jgi:cation diffusion facilitator CzcD-associated flavoprotein CzcO
MTTLTTDTPAPYAPALPARVAVAVIGSGFAGLGMAIRLKELGADDFVVLERGDDVGGTWRDNTYPGCQCDVPSHLYSFSFALNPQWTRTFSMQPEIWSYLRRVADDFDVRRHVRFGHDVTAAEWDEPTRRWRLTTPHGTLEADTVVAGVGALSEPSYPDLPGLENFTGAVFHSAKWDHDYDLTGKRVAVVGTGASAIQFVPKIQPAVEAMTIFQRTAPWVMPHPDRPLSRTEKRVYRALPKAQKLMRDGIYWARELTVLAFMHPQLMRLGGERMARRHLAKQVADPELRAKLTPGYRMGCKRVLLSNEYFPALQQPNVDVVTSGISEVRESSVVDADGVEREVDAIIFGTGFKVIDMPFAGRVRGRSGRTLEEVWRGKMQAHKGTTIAGFPNFFMLMGPNTGLGHNSVVFMIEAQIAYVIDALRTMRERRAATVEVRREVQDAYDAELQKRLQGTVWNTGGCASWYLDEHGRNSTIWPGFTWPFKRRTLNFDAQAYELRTAPAVATAAPPAAPAAA